MLNIFLLYFFTYIIVYIKYMEVFIMSNPVGRPKVFNSKIGSLNLKMSKKDLDKFTDKCRATGKSKSATVRKWIQIFNDLQDDNVEV